MKNKTAIWVFLVLLVAACIYQISFTFINSSVEKDAMAFAKDSLDVYKQSNPDLSNEEEDNLVKSFRKKYLSDQKTEKYLGFTFADVQKKQINRGLDLQGGMNVTLEVSVIDLIKSLAANKDDKSFNEAIRIAQEEQKNSDKGFVELFAEAFAKVDPNAKLAGIFHSRDNQDLIPRSATNEEVIEIIKEEAEAAVKQTEEVIRKRIDNLGVVQPKVQSLGSGRILVELPGIDDEERVGKMLEGAAKLEFWETYDNTEFFQYLSKANEILKREEELAKKESEAATIVDTNAKIETTEQEATNEETSELDKLLEENLNETASDTSNAPNTDNNNPLWKVLGPSLAQNGQNIAQGPVVGYAFKQDTAKVNAYLQRPDISSLFPRHKMLWDANPIGEKNDVFRLYVVKVSSLDGKAPLEGDIVDDARGVTDQNGRPEVSLSMKPTAAKTWKIITGANVGKSVAIALDNRVYSAPNVQGEIAGGRTSISGSFSVQEASDLASILKSGKLEVPSRVIQATKVGPTLGADNINSSFRSFLIALLLVLIYMVIYYNKAGLVANIALLANVFFIVGILASLGATVTLSGIAGIILTIGMSVDANVLIFERIREEISQGKGVKLAVQDGYKNALTSILDSNITTFLTGLVLLSFGTGPIQGFATTLLIGICTSLFSAVIITRLIMDMMLEKNANIKFDTSFSKNLFKNSTINFVNKRKVSYAVSGVLIVASLFALFTKGLDYGVDFSGGRTYQVSFENELTSSEEIAKTLSASFVEDGNQLTPEVKTYGNNGDQLLITTKYAINEQGSEATQKVTDALAEGLNKLNNPYKIERSDVVGPTIADDIKSSSYKATLLALLIMFMYIVFRFGKWQFGMGAVAALFHDVILVMGVYSVFWGVLPFSLEIDQAFIAAILTVVGYSVNDTVIIFDRIREYLGIFRKEDKHLTVNKALNSTLSRTFNTSVTTFMVLLLIFLFGGESIRGFVFAIMIGVVIGTYSSLFIATPVMLDLDKQAEASNLKKSRKNPRKKLQTT